MRKTWPNREGWEYGDRFNGAGSGGYFIGGRSPLIKSIQAGSVTLANVLTATATITAVVTANSLLYLVGSTYSANTVNTADAHGHIELTNTTTITGTRTTNADSATLVLAFVVLEFYPGVLKSVQRGIISLPATATGTATITAVNTTQTAVTHLGMRADANAIGRAVVTLTLTNTTTVTATNALGTANVFVSYQVAEWT